jgi:hypothetical protein
VPPPCVRQAFGGGGQTLVSLVRLEPTTIPPQVIRDLCPTLEEEIGIA